MGKVPSIRHGETVVTECAAICAYLADAFPEAGLAPVDRGAYYRWLFFAAGPVEAAVTNKALGTWWCRLGRERTAGYGTFADTMDTLEYAVSQSPYIAGDRFSAADVYVGSQVGFGLTFKIHRGAAGVRGVLGSVWWIGRRRCGRARSMTR